MSKKVSAQVASTQAPVKAASTNVLAKKDEEEEVRQAQLAEAAGEEAQAVAEEQVAEAESGETVEAARTIATVAEEIDASAETLAGVVADAPMMFAQAGAAAAAGGSAAAGISTTAIIAGVAVVGVAAAAGGSSDSSSSSSSSNESAPVSYNAVVKLTSSTDSLPGTSTNDDYLAESGTLASADTILDASTTDSDRLTINFKASDTMTVQPTVTKVENIVVNYSGLTGAEFDATNVTGSTITYNLTATTTDGGATVKVAGDNNVTAGSGVKSLTVTGLKSGTVDGGSATTLDVTTAVVATNTTSASIKVAGNTTLAIDNALGTALAVTNIEASKDATVTITGTVGAAGAKDQLISSGAGKVTVSSTSAILKTVETFVLDTIKLTTITAADTLNFTSSSVNTIDVAATNAVVLDNLVAGTVNLSKDSASATVSGKSSTSSATVNLNADTTTLALDTGGTYTVNASANAKTITKLTYVGATGLNLVGDVTITDLTDTNATDVLTVKGTGTLTVSGVDTTVRKVNASDLAGGLKFTQDTAGAVELLGGSGKNTMTVITTTETTKLTGGAEVDTVNSNGTIVSSKQTIALGGGDDVLTFKDLGSLNAATISVTGGDGNDTIKLGGTTAIATAAGDIISIDGGEGTADIIEFITGADVGKVASTGSGAISFTNVEILKFAGDLEIRQALVDGTSYTVRAGTGASDHLTVVANSNSASLDLSTLTFESSVEKTVYDASAQTAAMVITGSSVRDDITLTGLTDSVSTGDGKDQVTMDVLGGGSTVNLGDGNDTFVAIGNTTKTDTISVTTGSGSDTIDLMDYVITDTNKILVTDFTGGTGGDVLKLAVAANGLAAGDMYDAGDTVSLVTAAVATTLAANAVSANGAANVIFDTASKIANATLNAAATGTLAIESDTGRVLYDADGDFTDGDSVHFATLTITGTLTSANFLFA